MTLLQTSTRRSTARKRTFVVAGEAPVRLQVPEDAFTLPGFCTWVRSGDFPNRARTTFIDGDIYLDMSDEDPETHAAVKGAITEALIALNRELKLGKLYPDGVLVTDEAAGLSNNPDATFLSRATLLSGRATVVQRPGQPGRFSDIQGAPDMVLEVVSDSSEEKDRVRLREAYFTAGVAEYWLVDARGAAIDFQILARRKAGFVAAPGRGGWQRSPVFGRSFRLTRVRDEFGLWEYSLLVRTR